MKLETINTPFSLSDIEVEITQMSEMLRQGWFAVGTKLLAVEKHELYKQGQQRSYTAWLNSLSQTLDLKPSTLWKYLKIVRMVDEINFPTDKINLKNVTGLEQIARIYDANHNAIEACTLIHQLDEKLINVADVTKLAKVISNPPPDGKSPTEIDPIKSIGFKKFFGAISSILLVVVVIFNILDMT